MTDREIFERFGYDPDDPVPRDDEGHRIIPDRLVDALTEAPALEPDALPYFARHATQPDLTPAVLEVLRFASQGLDWRGIARVTRKSPNTVVGQLKDARLRLKARNTTHACCEAIRRGLIT